MHAAVSFDERPSPPPARRVAHLARRLDPFVNFAGILVGAGWLLALLFQHLQLVAQPSPHEYNESGEWHTTFLLATGRNPYSAAELTGAASFFGPLYHWVVIAFKPLFGLGYPAHRMVNLLCIAGVLWLLVTRMHRLGTSLGIALCSAALFYWLTLQNIMVCARPDALGLLLFLLALVVPWENGYSPRSVAAGLVCTLLAFHCKAYFTLALLPLLAGVWLARSWRASAICAVAFALALAGTMAALNWRFSLYYLETIVMQKNSVWANSQDSVVSVLHARQLLERSWPYLLLLACAAFPFFNRLRRETRAPAGSAGAPSFRDRALLLLLAVFLFHLVLVNDYMGSNGGASFTYHLHLIFPPMLLLAAAATTAPPARVLFGAGLMAFLMLTLSTSPVPDGSPGYRRLQEVIDANDPVLDSMSAATELLAERGRPIHNNGYSICLPFVTMWDRFLWDPKARLIRETYDRVGEDAEAKIAARAYKIILTTDDRCFFGDIETVHKNYQIAERIDLPMYFGYSAVEVWKPKPLQTP